MEEVKLKSEEISRKSYKSKLQSFVIKKPVTRAEIPADSTPKGLLKLGEQNLFNIIRSHCLMATLSFLSFNSGFPIA